MKKFYYVRTSRVRACAYSVGEEDEQLGVKLLHHSSKLICEVTHDSDPDSRLFDEAKIHAEWLELSLPHVFHDRFDEELVVLNSIEEYKPRRHNILRDELRAAFD